MTARKKSPTSKSKNGQKTLRAGARTGAKHSTRKTRVRSAKRSGTTTTMGVNTFMPGASTAIEDTAAANVISLFALKAAGNKFRALCSNGDFAGPDRATWDEAEADAKRHQTATDHTVEVYATRSNA